MPAGPHAELPQLARGALVLMNDFVELERIELASVIASEPVTDALDEISQTGLVVGPNDCPRGAASSLGVSA